jgi:hypothetical protein
MNALSKLSRVVEPHNMRVLVTRQVKVTNPALVRSFELSSVRPGGVLEVQFDLREGIGRTLASFDN